MFGMEMLDVLIGLVTVYLVFGLACTAIVEAIAAWSNVRSKNLEAALKEFFAGEINDNETFVKAFYAHPLVQALSKGDNGRPSYIPPAIVGQVVEALLTAKASGASLDAAVTSLPGTPEDNRIKGLLGALVKQAGGNAAAFREAVETHFNTTMERASGWFKRHTQNVALVASLALVLLANLDTVDLATSLASNPQARLKMVEIAEQSLKKAEAAETQSKAAGEQGTALQQARDKSTGAKDAYVGAVSAMNSGGLQFGWTRYPAGALGWLTKLAGLLVSILAVSLGAPFWFDVLQRFMQVRAAGTSPHQPEGSKK